MLINLELVKVDNGYRAEVVFSSDEHLVPVGKELFNRQFHPHKKGEVFGVVANYSKAGRVVVKQVGIRAISVETKKEEKPKMPSNILKGYYINSDARLMFTTAKAMSEARPERAVKLMMVGPSGYGKTTLPKLFAEVTGKRFLRMNCATVRDPEEWFGYREAREGSTVFLRSQFAKEIEKGNLVVVLDEFNRLEPWLHNTLFPLLDDDGATVVHDEHFRIGSGVIVVGTINTGYKYTGTFELDEALLNRFDLMLEVGPMPYLEEVNVLKKRTNVSRADAQTIVRVSNILRQHEVVCSTRTTLAMATMVCAGMTIREAFEGAVVKRIVAEAQRKKVVDLVNTEIGHYEDRTVTNDVFSTNQDAETALPTATMISLDMGKKAGFNFSALGILKLIRQVELSDGSNLSFSEARILVDKIDMGETVNIKFIKPTSLSNFLEELSRYGVTGSYREINS